MYDARIWETKLELPCQFTSAEKKYNVNLVLMVEKI
jgi:hypothetical protein